MLNKVVCEYRSVKSPSFTRKGALILSNVY